MSYPPPIVYGAPSKFKEWHPGQFEAIQQSISSKKSIVVHEAPTGFGKTILGVGESLITSKRVEILTYTKFLQDQYNAELRELSQLLDIRGRANYECLLDSNAEPNLPRSGSNRPRHDTYSLGGLSPTMDSRSYISVANAPCQYSAKSDCPLFSGGCTYYDRVRAAKWKQTVITNYALHLSANRFSEGIGSFPLLVLDEGHSAPQALSDAFTFELSEFEIKSLLRLKKYNSMTITEWSRKGSDLIGWVTNRIETARIIGDLATIHRLKSLKFRLTDLSTLVNERWILEDTDKGGKRFTPVDPSEFRSTLLNGANKTVIVSATFNRKFLGQMGIALDEVDYFEYDSPFPVNRRPIYLLPTSQMNYETSERELLRVVQTADQIIARRLDRKGIIPTGSYARQKFFLEHSQFRDLMIAPESAQDLLAAVERFKASSGPTILVGPNFATGVDLPHNDCRYVIVPKLPYPPSNTAIYKARTELDSEYGTFSMANDLVQVMGRGMRSITDWCEGFILDSNAENVFKYSRHLFPKWFLKAIKPISNIPEAIVF